jgi:hypothetical protein
MRDIVELLMSYERDYGRERIFFITDTTSSDVSKLNYSLDCYGYPPLHTFYGSYKDVISTDSYALGACGVSYENIIDDTIERGWFSVSGHCETVHGIERPRIEQIHNAADDALYMIQEHMIHISSFNDRRYDVKCT